MQKHAKSITVIDESDRHFSTFAKTRETLIQQRGNNLFANAKLRCKIPYRMSKPPLGIGVKRNDLRPWRALAPTRLSWRDPSCGNHWLPRATPPAAPPRPTTTTALLTWARRRLQLRPPVCAQTSPRRPANLSQAAPARLPDAFQTPPRRLPAVSPAVSQTSPSRLPDGSQRGGGHQKAPNGPKVEKGAF